MTKLRALGFAFILLIAANASQASTVLVKIRGTGCALCVQLAKKHLSELSSVRNVEIDSLGTQVRLNWVEQGPVDKEVLTLVLTRAGFLVQKIETGI
ncbi:cation transporter [Nostoc sp. CHAB 5834]|nr:cation transporter [Nostoc sp. CHAB 5834]